MVHLPPTDSDVLKTREHDTSSFVLVSQYCFGYSKSLVVKNKVKLISNMQSGGQHVESVDFYTLIIDQTANFIIKLCVEQ